MKARTELASAFCSRAGRVFPYRATYFLLQVARSRLGLVRVGGGGSQGLRGLSLIRIQEHKINNKGSPEY